MAYALTPERIIQKLTARSSHSEAKVMEKGSNGKIPTIRGMFPLPLIIATDSTSDWGLIIPIVVISSTTVTILTLSRKFQEKSARLNPTLSKEEIDFIRKSHLIPEILSPVIALTTNLL